MYKNITKSVKSPLSELPPPYAIYLQIKLKYNNIIYIILFLLKFINNLFFFSIFRYILR